MTTILNCWGHRKLRGFLYEFCWCQVMITLMCPPYFGQMRIIRLAFIPLSCLHQKLVYTVHDGIKGWLLCCKASQFWIMHNTKFLTNWKLVESAYKPGLHHSPTLPHTLWKLIWTSSPSLDCYNIFCLRLLNSWTLSIISYLKTNTECKNWICSHT